MDLEILKDIAWMPFDFPVSENELELINKELDDIDDKYWYWCTFRNAYLIVLYGNTDIDNKEIMDWLPHAENAHTIKKISEEFVFKMTTVKPRIIVIRTMPGMKMNIHTDCSINELNLFQPKLRLISRGYDSALFFINDKNERVYIPKSNMYMMSGTVKHGMDNVSNLEKYTLCWGDPWVGDDLNNLEFTEYLNKMFIKHYDKIIWKSKLGSVNHAANIKDKFKEKLIPWNEFTNANDSHIDSE